jgi:hypothetical protein
MYLGNFNNTAIGGRGDRLAGITNLNPAGFVGICLL